MPHHTARTALSTSRWDDLDTAVRRVACERATGRLVVTGNSASGVIYFADGLITLATSRGEDPSDVIDPSWIAVDPRDGSIEIDPPSALDGSAPDAAKLISEVIGRVVTGLRSNESATIEFRSSGSVVHSRVGLAVDEWFDLDHISLFAIYPLTRIA